MFLKCEEYHAWGVPYCWVVDPVQRTAWEYHSGSEVTLATPALRAAELSIDVQKLFSALDTSV